MKKCHGTAVKVMSAICAAALLFTSVPLETFAAQQTAETVEAGSEETTSAEKEAASEEAALIVEGSKEAQGGELAENSEPEEDPESDSESGGDETALEEAGKASGEENEEVDSAVADLANESEGKEQSEEETGAEGTDESEEENDSGESSESEEETESGEPSESEEEADSAETGESDETELTESGTAIETQADGEMAGEDVDEAANAEPAEEETEESAEEETEEGTEEPAEEETEEGTEEPAEEETEKEKGAEKGQAALSINATEVDLYCIRDSTRDKISMPDSYAKSFQLKVTGLSDGVKPQFSVVEGYYVTVTDDGLIEPTENAAGYEKETSKIEVTVGGTIFCVTVNTHSYDVIYANGVMDQYIEENIDSSMSPVEKLDVFAAFPAQYNYDAGYHTSTDMIIFGGGSCWASASAILYMCEKVGIRARINNYGGSYHENVVAYIDGKMYIAEVYDGNAPRAYGVAPLETPFGLASDSENESNALISCYSGEEEDVVIPSELSGNKIIGIMDKVFCNHETLRSCTIPEGVVSIGYSAFAGCTNLENVTIPSTLRSVGYQCFSGCGKLKHVDLSHLTQIGSYAFDDCDLQEIQLSEGIEKIEKYTFGNNKNLKEVSIPASVKEIGESAFQGCGLTQVNILGNNIKSIGANAFTNNSLVSFRIPASVTSIGDGAFIGNETLEEFEVDPANGSFSAVDGILFDKSRSKLIRYPGKRSGSSYRIPDSVTEVSVRAFDKALNLNEIIIPKSVRKLDVQSLFIDPTKSGMVYRFEGSAPEIGADAFMSFRASYFNDCVCDVYYPASDQSWEALVNDYENFHGVIWHAVGENGSENSEGKASEGGNTSSSSAGNNGTGSADEKKTVTSDAKLAQPKITKTANTTKGIQLIWKKVPGATKYYIYCKKGNSGWKKVGSTKKTYYTVTTSNGKTALKDKNYYLFTVRAEGVNSKTGKKILSSYNKKGTGRLYFAAPVIKLLKNKKSKAMTVKWSKYSQASVYQVQYSLSKSFKSGNKTVTVKSGKGLSKTIKSLKKGKLYYVRVRAKFRRKNGKMSVTPWSAVRVVKVRK